MSGRLEGKVALITGAARGMGRAQAVRFAQEGADIIAVDVCAPVEHSTTPGASPEDLAETVRQVESLGRKICAFEADVRDQQALTSAVDAGVEALGRLDVICATAGISSSGAAVEMGAERWQTMLDVNLTGVWRTCKAGIPHIVDGGRGGSIILISSIAGLRGLVSVGHYTAAKHGVVGLMKSLANELAPHSVRVNTIHPANTRTTMIQNESTMRTFCPSVDEPTQEQFEAGTQSMHLLPVAMIEPEDIANASLFLASDESRYITGVTLPVDAGHCVK
ncbi:mycofactocin-coupled SDR family oxidoreductase [Rhodococcus hoagii]|uniref:mycofactocin-coupled SDR family oxidoreductase n=1 Tax=Rhodococcus hoagii TaxID=43767 RepID=UPI0007CD9BEC|nr:mycofactocin-coupled SDR family oxidoreductase [Prescottella equi]MBM4533811.1 mycofactocin-coupled SDR family oxidoreductase [Prescottella equi]NKR84522.1 mycofactocin-coupled SDR family oxidoreductase [Prescottella equi]ORJ99620.1 3-ketoacyl-ACP reductase [Prescottella equi]ORL09677.1 3-ketoacyl-ACP reductase [Prescottella equi]ORL75935.1 3-ketoacyl-ACP reductase [Prescottella equi]